MSWRWRDPRNFPADFYAATRQAIVHVEEDQILTSGSKAHCLDLADQYRYWRWCLREKPHHDWTTYKMIEDYDLRTRLKFDREIQLYILYLKACPKLIQTLLELNPELKSLVL